MSTTPELLNTLLDNKATRNCINIDQKKAAIETHEPLAIVVIPPETGKFGVLLRRIDYMLTSNVDYDTIVVISPTNADVENLSATNRFTGNMTIAQFASKIRNKYPIRYKHVIINDIHDNMTSDLNDIIDFISKNKQSLFIIGTKNESETLKDFIDSGAFTMYNL